jgi:hypothetical protein
MDVKNVASTGIQSPNRPARSELQYRLSYRSSQARKEGYEMETEKYNVWFLSRYSS